MRGVRPRAGTLSVQRCSTLLYFKRCAASGTGMPGPVRADGLFFACAKSKVKSTHKGKPPYGTPGRVPAFGWVEGTRMSQPAPTCFLSRQTTPTRPGLYRKTPLHSARSGRASQLAGESAPRWGSFCAAVQHLTFLRRMPPSGGRGCGVSAPARRVPFRMHEKEPKVHLRGDAP